MTRFEDDDELRAFARELARNRGEETPEFVANSVIVSTHNYGQHVDEVEASDRVKLLNFSAEPFVDDPSETTRVWPKDVLATVDRYPYPEEYPDNLRDLAVHVLADLIREAMDDAA